MPITSSHFQNYLRSKKSMSASEVECCARLSLVLCENRTGPRRLMPANGAAYSRALGSRRRFGECCNSAAGRCFDAVRGEAHGLGDHPSESRPPAVRVARATAMSEYFPPCDSRTALRERV